MHREKVAANADGDAVVVTEVVRPAKEACVEEDSNLRRSLERNLEWQADEFLLGCRGCGDVPKVLVVPLRLVMRIPAWGVNLTETGAATYLKPIPKSTARSMGSEICLNSRASKPDSSTPLALRNENCPPRLTLL